MAGWLGTNNAFSAEQKKGEERENLYYILSGRRIEMGLPWILGFNAALKIETGFFFRIVLFETNCDKVATSLVSTKERGGIDQSRRLWKMVRLLIVVVFVFLCFLQEKVWVVSTACRR